MNRNYYNSLQGLNGEDKNGDDENGKPKCNWWCRNRGLIQKIATVLAKVGVPGAAIVATAIKGIGDSLDQLRTFATGLLPADEDRLNFLLQKIETWSDSIKIRIANATNSKDITEANALLKDIYLVKWFYTNPNRNVQGLETEAAKQEQYLMTNEVTATLENIILASFSKNNISSMNSTAFSIPNMVKAFDNETFTHKIILSSTNLNNTSVVDAIVSGTLPPDKVFEAPGDPINIIKPDTPEQEKDGIPIWVWLLIGVGAYKLLKKK